MHKPERTLFKAMVAGRHALPDVSPLKGHPMPQSRVKVSASVFPVESADFWFPTGKIHSGEGVLDSLREQLEQLGITRLLVVSGSTIRRGGAARLVREALGATPVVGWIDAEVNPTLHSIEKASDDARKLRPHGLLSLGGGSVIDTAKLISLDLASEEPLERWRARALGDGTLAEPPFAGRTLPHVCIPTTGSGSELTSGASVRVPGNTEKWFFWSEQLQPRHVYLDPRALQSTPSYVLQTTGVNALSHAVEAVYSRSRNPWSTALALHAIELLGDVLPRIADRRLDDISRYQAATTLAGAALSGARSALAHAICHSLTTIAGAGHGEAHAIMLPHVLRANESQMPDIDAQIARALTGSKDLRTNSLSAATEVTNIVAHMGLPTRLESIGIDQDSLPLVAANTLTNRAIKFNPVALTQAEILTILRAAW